jgi:hypothetical protein
VHFNKAINLLITPIVDFYKQRLTRCLKMHNITYTDGIDINNLEWKAFDDADIYESDLTAQDAKQGPTSVTEILTFYKLLGFPLWSINCFLRLYKFTARDQKTHTVVENGVAKATGGPDTGFGNLVNNLLIHRKPLFHPAHLTSVILGDDLASQFKRQDHQTVLTLLEETLRDVGTENKPFWNRAAFEFCSRVGVATDHGTYRFYPNPMKVHNSLTESQNNLHIFSTPDEITRAVSAALNHSTTMSFLQNFHEEIVPLTQILKDLRPNTSDAVQKQTKKLLSKDTGALYRQPEEIGAYLITVGEQNAVDETIALGYVNDAADLVKNIRDLAERIIYPEEEDNISVQESEVSQVSNLYMTM